MTHHALTIFDRGTEHVHRFRPRCSCGQWTGTNHRRRNQAIKDYRGHVAIVSRQRGLAPLPLTPEYLLPELLRTGS